MKWYALVAAMLYVLWASPVHAATPYLEFSPDYREALLTATAATVEEWFLPLNDHLSGFDFWVSNDNQPATVTFTLKNSGGTTLSSRTVTIGAIPDTDDGQRYTVNLPAQVTVTPNAPHRVSIQSSSTTLRLYWAVSNELLAHNAPPPPAYSTGTARIDGVDRAESFLYALYETNETVPPVITDVAVQQPLTGSARIVFHANEPVDTQLRYGIAGQGLTQTIPFGGGYQSCVAGIQECATLFSVTPGLAYAYELTARDVWGNQTVATGEFTADGEATTTTSPTSTPTPSGPAPSATPDTTAPVISNLRAAQVTANGATIAWTTDEAANGIVVIFALPFLTYAAGDNDQTLELEHAIGFGSLYANSPYRARVTTSDAVGNSTVATVDFTTGIPTPVPSTETPTPTPSASATPTPSVSIDSTADGAAAQWSAPAGEEPTNGYRIDIIGADGKLIRTVYSRTTSANLGDVPDGATIIVYADNNGVYEKVAEPSSYSRPMSFLERMVTVLPYALGALVLGIIIAVVALKLRERKKTPPPAAGPAPLDGAQPRPSTFPS